MKKLFLILLILFLLNLEAKETCEKILKDFEIDLKTKGYKGWQRVCNNNKLYLYTKIQLNKENKEDICNCFYYDYKDREIFIKDKQ